MTTTTAEQVARTFSAILREWLSADEIAEAIARNKAEGPSSSVCHSHDHCDANVAMEAALEAHDIQIWMDGQMDDPAVVLWNAAWKIAKASDFATDATDVGQPYDPEAPYSDKETAEAIQAASADKR